MISDLKKKPRMVYKRIGNPKLGLGAREFPPRYCHFGYDLHSESARDRTGGKALQEER